MKHIWSVGVGLIFCVFLSFFRVYLWPLTLKCHWHCHCRVPNRHFQSYSSVYSRACVFVGLCVQLAVLGWMACVWEGMCACKGTMIEIDTHTIKSSHERLLAIVIRIQWIALHNTRLSTAIDWAMKIPLFWFAKMFVFDPTVFDPWNISPQIC